MRLRVEKVAWGSLCCCERKRDCAVMRIVTKAACYLAGTKRGPKGFSTSGQHRVPPDRKNPLAVPAPRPYHVLTTSSIDRCLPWSLRAQSTSWSRRTRVPRTGGSWPRLADPDQEVTAATCAGWSPLSSCEKGARRWRLHDGHPSSFSSTACQPSTPTRPGWISVQR